jgi:hypothetical protein
MYHFMNSDGNNIDEDQRVLCIKCQNNVKTIYIFFSLLKSVLKVECNYQENIFSGPF